MAVTIKSKKGKDITLLSPREKGNKYADELSRNIRYTNDGRYKADKDGVVSSLTESQRAYRSGYLDARKDIGKAYSAMKKKKG